MGNLLILGNDEILGNIDNKRKNIVSNTSFAQKNSFYIGGFLAKTFCNYLIDLLFDNSNFLQAIGLRMFTVQLWNVPRQDFS